MGSSASQAAMGPYMAIPPNELCQAYLGFLPIAIGTQVHLLMFERVPQSLDKDVVVTASPARPTDLELLCFETFNE